jgi:glycosyltransferase involved in cell wall biosynthesis
MQKKICHIISSIDNEASGPTYSVTRLCTFLKLSSVNLVLITLTRIHSFSDSTPWIQFFPRSLFFYKLGFSFSMFRWLIKQSRLKSIDLIHNHGLWMLPNIYPGYITKKFKIPLLISPRGTLSVHAMKSGTRLKILFWFFFQKNVLKRARCFHATSYAEYNDIRRLGFKQPVSVIPNGIEIPKLNALKINCQIRTLLFLGRIHPIKGLDLLLPAWQELQNNFPSWRLKIVGPDNRGYLNQIKLLADKLNLQRVEFSGPAYQQNKILEFYSADLFVLPSYSENFGMAIAEALASGTPVVVSKGAPWEAVVINKCGWWIDVDVKSFIVGLTEAMNKNPSELKQMGENGRNFMERDYSWDVVAKKMAKTYEWMLDGGDAPTWIELN